MRFPFFRRRPTNGQGTLREMPPAVRDLGRPWKILAGDVEGLTPALEKEFRFGQSVISLDGRYRLGGNLKGGSSAMWIPAGPEAFEAYRLWRERDGIPRVKDRRAFRRLEKLLQAHEVRLINGSWSGPEQASRNFSEKRGYLYAVTWEILSRLPASHLEREAFRILQIGGWGPDGAKASAYENGRVMMYDFAVNGARRTYVGLLLHELGHAQEASFPETKRRALREAFGAIARAGAVMGVEFLVDAQARKLYQLRVFEEFVAETYMIYTSQGEALRRFVGEQEDRTRRAWDEAYGLFRDAFEGIEYR